MDQEKEALIDIYNYCNGVEWYNSQNWCSDHALQDWWGVTIDDTTGRVIKLELSRNNLTGDLSKWTSIANLRQLRDLWLKHNHLTGDISKWTSIANLPQLQTLALYHNNLTGDISKWTSIANLPLLQMLSLWENKVTGDVNNWEAFRNSLREFYQNRYHIIVTKRLLSKIDESLVTKKLESLGSNDLLLKKIFDPTTSYDIFTNILLYLDVRPEEKKN